MRMASNLSSQEMSKGHLESLLIQRNKITSKRFHFVPVPIH
jgi:hypothetical protein